MSRKGHAIGNRLGISKDWISHLNSFKYSNYLKNSFFIRAWISNFLQKINIWHLAIKIIQKKNIINVYILVSYLNNRTMPLIKNVFFIFYLQKDWYWFPTFLRFFKTPYGGPSIIWRETSFLYVLQNARRFFKKRFRLLIWQRRIFFKILTLYLERNLFLLLNYPIKVRFYNIMDYYLNYRSRVISMYSKIFLHLYEKDQRGLIKGIKTAVFYLCLGIYRKNSFLIAKTFSMEITKHRRIGKLLKFFFKIIREVFHLLPLYDDFNRKQRAEYLKIQISGKIDGKMRAVKKIYSFSKYKGKEIPIQTLNLNVDYTFLDCYTFAGVLGIKVWIA